MKKLLSLFLVLAIFNSFLSAEGSLDHLIKYKKEICLEKLQQASTEDLWDIFLEGQAKLFFEPEIHWITSQDLWKEVKNVLEIGSGKGAYLSKLAEQFPDKIFLGVEKLPLSVSQANKRYARENLFFQKGDAEIFNEQLKNFAEVVLFRLTLQHLKNPLLALQNAWHYLLDNGHIIIIDSCDSAKKTSHPIKAIDDALDLVAKSQLNKGIGNRKITLEILEILENKQSTFSKMYELVSSNVDKAGKTLYENIRLEGKQVSERYFNHSLLFLTLLERTYQVEIDISTVYDALKEYLQDENAWTIPGTHFLILKKR